MVCQKSEWGWSLVAEQLKPSAIVQGRSCHTGHQHPDLITYVRWSPPVSHTHAPTRAGSPPVSLSPTFHCLTRPNGLAFMVPGETLAPGGNALTPVASELECAVGCMIAPRCVYYIYLPGWRPAGWVPPNNQPPEDFAPNT